MKPTPLATRRQHAWIEPEKNRWPMVLFCGCTCTAILLLLAIVQPALMQVPDRHIYDFFLRSIPQVDANSRLVIVDLDEKSLAQYGQWPWPRYRVAELLEKINHDKPASIGLDILFAEPDRTSLGSLIRNVARDFDLDLNADQMPAIVRDNDQILARALATGPFVLATKFLFDPEAGKPVPCRLTPLKVALRGAAPPRLPTASSVLCNIEPLSQATPWSGFFNARPDEDGILRRVPLVMQYHDEFYPSLALATLMRAQNIDQVMFTMDRGQLQALTLGRLVIPVDPSAHLLIKYYDPGHAYDSISAADILAGGVAPERLQDKIVFIGTSAAGLAELHATPCSPVFPGVAVHATLVDNMLTNDYLSTPVWFAGLTLVLILLLGIATTMIVAWVRAAWAFHYMVASLLLLWLGSEWLFQNHGLFFAPSALMATIFSIYLLLTVLRYCLDEAKLRLRTRELTATQDVTIDSMAALAEYRDPETSGHIRRTREYIRIMADQLRSHPKYAAYFSDTVIEALYKLAPLHDIGKVGVLDNILLKPGSLNDAEAELMKKHTITGRNIISAAEKHLASRSFLELAGEIAYTHHEKWDGSGYPRGLAGEEIPISGRLMALIDVYDAMISKRPYKHAYSHAEAVQTIRNGKGNHFDPHMVDAFMQQQEQIRAVALQYADFDEERQALRQPWNP